MNLLQEVQKIAVKSLKKRVPKLRTGLTVRVHQKIKEGNKERIQVFEGLIIKINSGHAADKSFTVRKLVGGIGVERIFPLYSPKIEKIEVIKSSKVRRSKLYYMRERSGKSARLKESFVSKKSLEDSYDNEASLEMEAELKAAEEAAKAAEAKAKAEAEAAEKAKAEEEAKAKAKAKAEAEKAAAAEKTEEEPKEEAAKEEAPAAEEKKEEAKAEEPKEEKEEKSE